MERRVIAICASWEDEENLNLFMKHFIGAAEAWQVLPLCVTFDRGNVEARGEESLEEFLSAFDIPGLSGLVLFGEMIRSDRISERLIQMAEQKGLPLFMLERQYEGCINLAFDYSAGFTQVARHMIGHHQCRDVVVVAGLEGNPYSETRVEICRRLLAEEGVELPPERILYGGFWDVPTFQALDAYFENGGSMPRAFLCINDAMALAVCEYLAERGIQVPGDVLVSGFDGTVNGEEHEPSITTAQVDYDALFARIFDTAENWNPGQSGKTAREAIPFVTHYRRSCGCQGKSNLNTAREIGELKKANLDYSRHIREMGRFIRGTLSMDSLTELAKLLPPRFSMWPEPYYFAWTVGEEPEDPCQVILNGNENGFEPPAIWQREGEYLPDFASVRANPEIRVLLVRMLQSRDETLGCFFTGMRDWSMRLEQRFEEQALFLSSAVSAVCRNRRLMEANEEILRMAEHDFLTGLYNRRGFLREMEWRIRQPGMKGRSLMIVSMDMDYLKKINDRYGHLEGDFALQCMGKALREVTAGKGICGRFGGDEFAMAFLMKKEELPDLEELRGQIEDIARRFSGRKEYELATSLGACACPVGELPPLEELMAKSDQEMYRDKAARHRQRED